MKKPLNITLLQLPLSKRDPRNIRGGFYTEVAELLADIKSGRESRVPSEERITLRERIAAMALIGRMLSVLGIGAKEDNDDAGSSVRKYTTAFAAHDAGRRKKAARPTVVPDAEPDLVELDLNSDDAAS